MQYHNNKVNYLSITKNITERVVILEKIDNIPLTNLNEKFNTIYI